MEFSCSVYVAFEVKPNTVRGVLWFSFLTIPGNKSSSSVSEYCSDSALLSVSHCLFLTQ